MVGNKEMSKMTPEMLRTMAEAYDKKGNREHDLGQVPKANDCWDEAMRLRLQANEIEDRH